MHYLSSALSSLASVFTSSPEPLPPPIIDQVVDLRIRIITVGLYAKFDASNAQKQEVITRQIQLLKKPTQDLLKTWDEASLQTYLQWLQSPTMQKIETAIREKKLTEEDQLENVFLAEELQELTEFKQTPTWQSKNTLESLLKPTFLSALIEIRRELSVK